MSPSEVPLQSPGAKKEVLPMMGTAIHTRMMWIVLVHTLLPFHPLKLKITVDQRRESHLIKQNDLVDTTEMSQGRDGVSTKDIRVSHFSHYCDKMPGKGRLILAHSSWAQSIMMGKSWQQWCGPAGHTVSTVRE